MSDQFISSKKPKFGQTIGVRQTTKRSFMKTILTIIVLLLSSAVYAGTTPNIDMYAPKAGASELYLGASLLSSKSTAVSGTTETKGSGYGLNLGYAKGFSPSVAFFVNQTMLSYKNENTTANTVTDYKTFSQTFLGFKGLAYFGQTYLYYNLQYAASLLEKRTSNNYGTNLFQRANDRDHIAATGGFGVPLSLITVGGLYKYYQYQDTKVETQNSEFTLKSGSGNMWKGYLQFNFGTKFGLAYGEEKVDDYDAESQGVTSVNGGYESETKFMQAYFIVPMSSSSDVLIDVVKTNLKDESAYSKYDNYLATLALKVEY